MGEERRAGELSDRRERAANAVRGSRVVVVATRVRDRLASAGRAVGHVVRESSLYRWLTKEPEPEVIVIDLRETWTLGPVIRLLDHVVDRIAPHWRRSTVKAGLDRVTALVEEGLQTRPGQLLVALLEPPEPPERGAEEDAVDESRPDGSDSNASASDEPERSR